MNGVFGDLEPEVRSDGKTIVCKCAYPIAAKY